MTICKEIDAKRENLQVETECFKISNRILKLKNIIVEIIKSMMVQRIDWTQLKRRFMCLKVELDGTDNRLMHSMKRIEKYRK